MATKLEHKNIQNNASSEVGEVNEVGSDMGLTKKQVYRRKGGRWVGELDEGLETQVVFGGPGGNGAGK